MRYFAAIGGKIKAGGETSTTRRSTWFNDLEVPVITLAACQSQLHREQEEIDVTRIFWTSMLLLGVLWALSACSGGAAPVPAASAPAATTSASEAAPAPGSTAVVLGSLTVEPAAASAPTPEASTGVSNTEPTPAVPLDLPKLQTSALKSYVANIQMRDEAVTPGAKATVAAPTDMEMRYHGDKPPEIYSWTTTGDHAGGNAQDFQMLMVGGQMYMFAPDQGKWVKMADSNPQNLPLKDDILDPAHLAQVVPTGLFSKENIVSQDEKVDGIVTTHYRANPTQMQQLLKDAGDEQRTPVSGQADFWVANDFGYLKQYTMIANLQDKDKAQYRETIRFTISNENQPVQIATPAPEKIMSQQEFDQSLATAGPPPADATIEPPPQNVPTAVP
jgi:hypothetical protein